MYSLQTSISINQASFHITNKGDFRMVLDCFRALNDPDLSPQEQLYSCLIIFYEELNSIEDIIRNMRNLEQLESEMNKFFNGGDAEVDTHATHYHLIDWDKDSNLICSAINNVAKQEVRSLDYLHWWTFLGYYMAIGDCALATIVSIRNKIAKGTKLETYEKKFRAENPEYFNRDYRSNEQKQAEDYIKTMWGAENG